MGKSPLGLEGISRPFTRPAQPIQVYISSNVAYTDDAQAAVEQF